MPLAIIDPLDGRYRALRTIQAPYHVVDAPERAGGLRISSAAFKPQSDGSISVDLEESMLRAGLSLTARYPRLPGAVALVSHRVHALRNQGLSVEHVPVAGNEHHGEVRFTGLTRSELRNVARVLADCCEVHAGIDAAEVVRQRAIRDAAKSGALHLTVDG